MQRNQWPSDSACARNPGVPSRLILWRAANPLHRDREWSCSTFRDSSSLLRYSAHRLLQGHVRGAAGRTRKAWCLVSVKLLHCMLRISTYLMLPPEKAHRDRLAKGS